MLCFVVAATFIILNSNLKLASPFPKPICVDGVGEDLTLFLTLPARRKELKECSDVLFRTLVMFWPFQYQKLKMVIVLDGEAKQSPHFADLHRQKVEKSLFNASEISITI